MIALVTNNSRLYYLLAKELKKRNQSFYSLSIGDEIPPGTGVVITSPEERRRVEYSRVVVAKDNITGAVNRALKTLRGFDRKYRALVISIDPGEKPGLAVLGDGTVITALQLNSPEEVTSSARELLELYHGKRITIKLGSGGGIYRNRILSLLQDGLDYPIQIVDERSTTPAIIGEEEPSHVKDIVAAINIALKEGQLLKEKINVKPKQGEIRKVQNGSRKLTGNLTLSKDLAERVAKGEITLERAIEIQRSE